MNKIMVKRKSDIVRLGLAVVMITVAGCASMQPSGRPPQQVADADRPPQMVQDCGIVSIGSPTKYACNGKTYTSFDLLKLRLAWEKSHGA
jgi:hypothetical protein